MKRSDCKGRGWRRIQTITAALLIGPSVLLGPVVANASAAPDPAVWIGSPIDGRWSDSTNCPKNPAVLYPSDLCSLPQAHHTPYFGKNAWSVDLQVANKARVYLYAAADNESLNNRTYAKVESVKAACGSGNISHGGHVVTIGIYLDKKRLIGRVAFSHINPVKNLTGWINRWETQLGTVGSYAAGPNNKCWGGVHHHVEMVSTKGYSCYNGTYTTSNTPSKAEKIRRTNFIGFVGGDYKGPRVRCP